MVAEVDLDFLQNSPQENILDSESWLKQKKYHYTASEREFDINYDIIVPKSVDWNVSYCGLKSADGFFAVYNAMEKDCTDLPALYESLKAKLEISGFTIVCQEAKTSEEIDGSSSKLTIWQDAAGNLYDLSLVEGKSPGYNGVNLVKENSLDVGSHNYNIADPADQLNIAALVAMPMNSYIGDENWKQKFNKNYGNSNFQPVDMPEGDNWCRAIFIYRPSDQENKKELLRYLKKEIQEATGKKMQLDYVSLSESDFDYYYEVETEQSRIELSSGESSESVTVNIESNRD